MILKMKIKLDIDEVQEIANFGDVSTATTGKIPNCHLQEFSEGEFTDVN